MPDKKTTQNAAKDKREGKSASTQAGEYVHEEMDHIRHGKHGARSAKQAIAIGLSKARRAGVKLPPPKNGSKKTKASAASANRAGASHHKPSAKRSRAATKALQHEGKSAASHTALSRQAHSAANHRSASERSASAKKAARTRARE